MHTFFWPKNEKQFAIVELLSKLPDLSLANRPNVFYKDLKHPLLEKSRALSFKGSVTESRRMFLTPRVIVGYYQHTIKPLNLFWDPRIFGSKRKSTGQTIQLFFLIQKVPNPRFINIKNSRTISKQQSKLW